MNWYAIFVKSGKEEDVLLYLNRILGEQYRERYQVFIPKRKLIEYRAGEKKVVYHKLFPGYILIGTDIINEIYFAVVKDKFSAIYCFLKQETYFQEIWWYEIEPLFRLIDDNGVIETSNIVVESDQILIVDGPLSNYTGQIKKINTRKGRAKIQIDFLQNKCIVDVSVNCIKKLYDNEVKRSIKIR